MFGIMAFSGWIYAQVTADAPIYTELPAEATPSPSVLNPEKINPSEIISPDIIRDNVYEAEPITIIYSPNVFRGMTANSLRGSFSQEAVWSLHNNFGFTLSANEGYYSNKYKNENSDLASDENSTSSATMFSARVFTNYASGKSTMHLDYGASYRYYPDQWYSRNDVDHDINAAYVYQMGKRARFQVQDHFSSSSNDPFGDVFSSNSSFGRLLSGSSYYDVIISQRRYSRNTVTASMSSDLTGKGTNVRFFGSYDNYWYKEQNSEIFNDYYSAKVGAGLKQRIYRWLSLGSTYSIQLNKDLKDSQIHRLEVGDIQFDLSPNVEVSISGGLEFIDNANSYKEGFQTKPTVRAGITYSTPERSLYANYSRTMMSLGGYGRLLPSDTFLVGMGQPVTERANFRVTWYYQRSSGDIYSDNNDSRNLSVYQGQASMEFLISRGLVASVSYSRRYQENKISSLSGIPYYERSIISAGLQYTWPSRRSR